MFGLALNPAHVEEQEQKVNTFYHKIFESKLKLIN